MTAYYNEIDPYAAQWLRNLIAAGHIAPGDVDERSIVDVRPSDLAGYTQCHFFAGIGIWSAALRQAGWPDDRLVWTGSCPCQPLSAAGKGLGTRDERHLWPVWFELIRNRRPLVVLCEQVASPDGLAWLDIVCTDLENEGYPVWPIDLCAAGFGAPHIRQRLFWVAIANGRGCGAQRSTRDGRSMGEGRGSSDLPSATQNAGIVDGMANSDGWDASTEGLQRSWQQRQQPQDGRSLRVGDPNSARRSFGNWDSRNDEAPTGSEGRQAAEQAGAVNDFWRDADWIACTDGKARPVESGTFPLAHGDFARVGRLRAYGNAINQQVATQFILAADEAIKQST